MLGNKRCSGTGMIPALDLYLATSNFFFLLSTTSFTFTTLIYLQAVESFSAPSVRLGQAHLISHNLPGPIKVEQGLIKNEPTFGCK